MIVLRIQHIKHFKTIFFALVVAAVGVGVWLYQSSKTAQEAEAAWWNEAWQYRTKLTIDHTKIDEDLRSFPVAVHLNSSRIDYSKTQNSGQDIRFTDQRGNVLNYEVEKWDEAATSTVWVNLPDIEADIPTNFYMYYGNSSVGSGANPTAVWDSNYVMVHHFEESDIDGGADDISDSTSNNNDGATSGMDASDDVTARINGGFDLDGTNDFVGVDYDASLKLPDSGGTLSAWIYPRDALGQDIGNVILKRLGHSNPAAQGNYEFRVYQSGPSDPHYLALDIGAVDDVDVVYDTVNQIQLNEWQLVTVTWTATTITFYRNGTVGSSSTRTKALTYANNTELWIGEGGDLNPYQHFDGVIDEVKISNAVRSAAWIKADYNSGQDTLLSFGQQETGRGPVGYWSFDEGFGTTAFNMTHATGTDGTISGATWKSEEFCVSGKCLEFDGTNDYVDIGDVSMGTTFTISAWIWPTGNQSATDGQIYGQAGGNTGMYYNGSSNKINYYQSPGGNGLSDSAMKTGEWHHVVVSNNAGTITFYLDGSDDGTEADDSSGALFSHIGSNTGNEAFRGRIDEVKIYPRALSAAEVKTEFAARGTIRGSSAVFGAYDQHVLSDGLVGYWPMNESAANTCSGGVKDSCDFSGLGNDGTWNNQATATTTSKFGRGVEFDGTGDYVSVADHASLDMNDQLTVSAWINKSLINQDDGIISKSASGQRTWGLANTSQKVKFSLSSAITDGDTRYVETTSNVITSANQWYYVVGVFNGTLDADKRAKIYIDGVESGTSATGVIPATLPNSTAAVGIGQDFFSNTAFNGRIDDARVYNRALSPAEVRQLYEWAPPPVAHWKMDEKVSGDAKTIYNTSSTTIDHLNGTTVDGSNNTGMDCTVRGQYGGACEFDGADTDGDRINAGDITSLNSATAFTLVGWFQQDVLDVYDVWLSKFDGTNGIQIETYGDGNMYFYVQNSGSGLASFDYSSVMSPGKWTHVAMVFDGNQSGNANRLKVLIDGVQQSLTFGSAIPASSPNLSGVNFHISTQSDTGAQAFDGVIDDVRIYDYALTSKQVVNVMNGREVWASAVGSPVGSAMGHWAFEEGGGTTAFDSSGHGNSGTYTANASSTPEAGKIGRGLELDGTGDYVSVTDSASISFAQTSLSFSSWIKPTVLSGNQAILGKNNEYRMVVNSTGNVGCQIHNGTTWQTAATSTSAVATTSWNHVNCTYDGTNLKTYFNGNHESSQALSSMSNDTTNALRLGDDESAAFNEINGFIDEVKIYNYALSEDEIKLEYNQGKSAVLGSLSTESDGKTPSNSAEREYCVPGDTSTCRPPIGEWRMDEKVSGDAKTIRDWSNNANDGTTVDGANNTGMDCTVRGKFGGACQFDGVDDYVNTADIDFATGGFSLSAWFRVFPGGGSAVNTIIRKRPSSGDDGDIWIVYNGTSGALIGALHDGTTAQSVPDATQNWRDSKWHHAVLSVSSSGMEFFVDGRSRGTDTHDNAFPTNNDTWKIGANIVNGQYLYGTIDQVRIYDYARTAAQAAWEYNRGAPAGWWKFDECQGTTLYNSGSATSTATLTIGAAGTNDEGGTCVSGDTSHAWYNGATGKRNFSLDFDGTDDYVQATDSENLRFDASTQDFSIFAWVKRNASGAAHYIISKEDAENDGWRLQFDAGNTVTCSVDAIDITSTSVIIDTNWHHVGCIIDRDGNGQVYLDGEPNGTATAISSEAMATTANIRMATRAYTSTNYLDGQIDEVRIFNYALTPLQVKTEYNNGAVNFAPSEGSP